MIDLKDVITKYPESLESAARFRAYMADLYPERADQVRIKVLADVISCGIVDEIMAGNVDNLSISRYRKQMEDRYGYSGRLVAESITKWVQAYAPSDELTDRPPQQAAPTPMIFDIDTIHIHSFEDTKVSATCREHGYTLHRCKCGYERRDSFTPFGEHQFEVVDEVFPTCIEDGRRDLLCAVCSEYKSESIPKTKHILGEWVIVQEASCETTGLSERKCRTCAKTETEQIAAKGHDWSDWAEQDYPTCTKSGKRIRQCNRCKKTEEQEVPATGHEFSEWVESKTRKGMQERFCKNCGLEETRKAIYFDPADFEIEDGVLRKYRGNGRNVEILDSVTSIGDKAFNNCKSLTSIMIPNSVTEIGFSAFAGCRSLTSVTIPDSVTEISSHAFFGCSSLASVTLSNSVTQIGCSAFENCRSLESIMIPSSVEKIKASAFSNCRSLTSITIPRSVTEIGEYAFSDCCDLTRIIVEKGNSTYDSRNQCNAIIETGTNKLISGCQNTLVPNNIRTIGDGAFCGCSNLTNILIPNSVTEFGASAFRDCCNLTSIIIPNSVTEFDSLAFGNCSNLTSIIIPDSVTEICGDMFSGCSRLLNIVIPNSVREIGYYAFADCRSLTSVTVQNSATDIDDYAFKGCKRLSICAPCGSNAEKFAKKRRIPFFSL